MCISTKAYTALALSLLAGFPLVGQTTSVTIDVDAAADRRAISPLIYGMNFASADELRAMGSPLNRRGGNAETRYNWHDNASNRASDWYFESICEASSTPGEAADRFVAETRAAGGEPMLTVPVIGWVAKAGPGRSKLASYSIAKYGPQTGSDSQWFPDAGNGVLLDGRKITWNDPHDANLPADASFHRPWIEHLVTRWGNASSGGVRFYLLDNEPGLWHETHRDVRPEGVGMEELLARAIDHAAMIKAVDPGALIAAPEAWGWLEYRYSGSDFQYAGEHGWNGVYPDRSAHGGADQWPWLIARLREESERRGVRLLDVATVHYYPQGGEFSNDVSATMQLRRNRSTRSLWDPAYSDETWIAETIRLVPRLRDWVAASDPGVKIGITEYSWGADGHINGATAQADVLGIFGREGVWLATRWTTPAATTPTFKAIAMYRNYDGSGATFGDTSIRAAAPNPDDVSAFAALRSSDGALTIMLINKQLATTAAARVRLANTKPAAKAHAWRLMASNPIERVGDLAVEGAEIYSSLPPQSITLIVVPQPEAHRKRPARR